MREITAKEAKELLDTGEAQLIDVRERNEWDEIRVPGAKLVPLSGYEQDTSAVQSSPNTIFICSHGNRSQVAALIYESASPGAEGLSMKGGINAWIGRAFPVDAGPPVES